MDARRPVWEVVQLGREERARTEDDRGAGGGDGFTPPGMLRQQSG